MLTNWADGVAILTLFTTVILAQWRFYVSLDKRLSDIKADVLSKLEYHERHDDRRFGDLSDNIWMLRLRNAAKDGLRAEQWLEDKKQSPLNAQSDGNRPSPL